MIVLTWLRLTHYGVATLCSAELRSQTLASLKPAISEALDSLLDEIHSAHDAKVLKTAFRQTLRISQSPRRSQPPMTPPCSTTKSCPLSKQAGRPHQHYLSKCSYIPIEDKQYLSHSRQVLTTEPEQPTSDLETEDPQESHNHRIKATSYRFSIKQSTYLREYFNHHPLLLILDTGGETSMIKTSIAKNWGNCKENYIKSSSGRWLHSPSCNR